MKKRLMIVVDSLFQILIRIVVCPFVFCTILTRNLINAFYFTAMFIVFGGEHISYVAKEKKQIYDIYKKVEDLLKTKEGENN